MTYAAYVITNLVSGKRYIGITRRALHRRWSDHKVSARKGVKTALASAIRKYGEEAFSIQHIASASSVDNLQALEIVLIRQEGTLAPGGYNLTTGGEGVRGLPAYVRQRIGDANRGRRHTPEAKALIGMASKGHQVSEQTKDRIRSKHVGKILSAEHREKLAAAKLGKKLPPRSLEHSRKISEGLVRAHERRRLAAQQGPE